MAKVRVVDLFCGIGGLSYGLAKAGLQIVAGIDNDATCKFGYEHNNKGAKFVHEDMKNVGPGRIVKFFGKGKETVRVLVGCAPCQPFSKLNLQETTEKHMEPLEKFADLVKKTNPHIVSMENVGSLLNCEKYPVFEKFTDTLKNKGYDFDCRIINFADYGVPQNRRRLVLLASRLGEIKLIKKTHENAAKTVGHVIRELKPIAAGEISKSDPLHRARSLSLQNLQRIKATPHDGGDATSWDKNLVLKCHKKKTGTTYRKQVYGRMHWNKPAPTMTTQCLGLGNGRYGHPEQDRAISLREAATFQTFPKKYKFVEKKEDITFSRLARYIGNAVPVRMGEVIGMSIKKHLIYNNVW